MHTFATETTRKQKKYNIYMRTSLVNTFFWWRLLQLQKS